MAKTSNLILLMDLVAKTPISPLTNVDGIYYEKTSNGETQRISFPGGFPVKYNDSSINEVDTSVSISNSYPSIPLAITFTDEDILGNINIGEYVHNNIQTYDQSNEFKYKIDNIKISNHNETPTNNFDVTRIEKQDIEGTGQNNANRLQQLNATSYNLSEILTKTFNHNDEHVCNLLERTVDEVNSNLVTVYNAIQRERQITHTYYDGISDILNGNYKESDLAWGYTLAAGHTLNNNSVVIGDQSLNLNGHANNEIDPIAGAIDSTTITNIFNGYGLTLNSSYFYTGTQLTKFDIFDILNTESINGVEGVQTINITKQLLNQVYESVIYKILLKVSFDTASGDERVLNVSDLSANGIGLPFLKDIVIKNGWNSIPVNKRQIRLNRTLNFNFNMPVTLRALHIFGEKSYTVSADTIVKKSANINKLYDKYKDDFVLTLPGVILLDSYNIVGEYRNGSTNISDNAKDSLILGNRTDEHVSLARSGFIRAFNGSNYSELCLNTSGDYSEGGNIVLSASGKLVTNNGILYNKDKIRCTKSIETNKLFAKNGFYLSSAAIENGWSNISSVTGFSGQQAPDSIEIASAQTENGNVLELNVSGGSSIDQTIQLSVGNTDTNNSRNVDYAKAAIKLNAGAMKIDMGPKVNINSLNGTDAQLVVHHRNGNASMGLGFVVAPNAQFKKITNVDEIQCKKITPGTLNVPVLVDGDLLADKIVTDKISPSNGDVSVYGKIKAKINNVSDVYVGVPIGTIVMWGNNEAPQDWLICNGRSLSRSTYKKLFNAIKTTYGSNDSSTFNLPNFQLKFPMGADSSATEWVCGSKSYNASLGKTGGEKQVKLAKTESGLPEMAISGYTVTTRNEHKGINVAGSYDVVTSVTTSSTKTSPHDASQAHNNIPPFISVNFIIKYQ